MQRQKLFIPTVTILCKFYVHFEVTTSDTDVRKVMPILQGHQENRLFSIIGPLLFYLYNCPRVTETPENHIFCFKKSINPLYGMSVVWYEAWFTLILQLSIICNFKCVPE